MVFGWTLYPTLPKSIALPLILFSFGQCEGREGEEERRPNIFAPMPTPMLQLSVPSPDPRLPNPSDLPPLPPSLPTIPTPLWCDFEGWSDILWSWLHLQCFIELFSLFWWVFIGKFSDQLICQISKNQSPPACPTFDRGSVYLCSDYGSVYKCNPSWSDNANGGDWDRGRLHTTCTSDRHSLILLRVIFIVNWPLQVIMIPWFHELFSLCWSS